MRGLLILWASFNPIPSLRSPGSPSLSDIPLHSGAITQGGCGLVRQLHWRRRKVDRVVEVTVQERTR
jgi:hypothetical protein